MSRSAPRVVGLSAALTLLLLALALGFVAAANLVVSFHYHPPEGVLDAAVPVGLSLLFPGPPLVLAVRRLWKGPLTGPWRIAILLLGLLFLIGGLALLAGDLGDFVLWVWIPLAGLPFLVLAWEWG